MLALPPTELVAALATAPELDQAVAAEAAVDRRARRHGIGTEATELVLDPAWSPPRVLPTELADERLQLGAV
jgi:hypothetical protein